MNPKGYLIDLSESQEYIDAAKEKVFAQVGTLEWNVRPAKSLLNRSGIKELLFEKRDHTVLVVSKKDRALVVPWFQAAMSLSVAKKNWFFEGEISRLVSLIRLKSFFLSLIEISSDLFSAAYILVESILYYWHLEKHPVQLDSENLKTLSKNKNWEICFMRCDAYLGKKSGGSVGHLAGVLNAMGEVPHQVELFSSDYLEEVNYQKVKLHAYSGHFKGWNIPLAGGCMYTDRAVTEMLRQDLNTSSTKTKVIYHRFHFGTLGALKIRKAFGLPLILEFNGSEVWVKKNWGGRKVGLLDRFFANTEELALRQADLIIVVSEVLKEQLVERGLDPAKICFVPNGVDPEKFNPEKLKAEREKVRKNLKWEDKTIIGFVGTFGKWHGTDVLAQVINQVKEARFIVVGDGMLKAEFEKSLTDEARTRVHMTGRISQNVAPNYLAACDAFVSPHVENKDGSRFFGSPTKLFEYMAMAKPVFASKLEQIGEIIKDKETGILLKPGDTEGWSKTLNHFVSNPEAYRGLGAAARAQVFAEYTWDIHWKKIESAFRARISNL